MKVQITLSVLLIFILSSAGNSAVFREGWEASSANIYIPTDETLIHGDEGYWYLGDTGYECEDECGPTPHRAEILMHNGSKALQLRSAETDCGCADNIWVELKDFSGVMGGTSGVEVQRIFLESDAINMHDVDPVTNQITYRKISDFIIWHST